MSFKVRIAQADRTIDVPTGATILATALDAGIGYPFGCQSGNCGACKSHLVKGEVTMEGYSEFALSDEEKARGLILACRAVPWEDSEVAWLDEDDLVVHPRRLLDCRVVGLDDATHDIKRIRLEIASGGPFDFSAGQFASVTFENCPPRD
jgi:ferredoxin-NAD(P)+ reductase (naphthalene dioxygenase ferredoxin-specific)